VAVINIWDTRTGTFISFLVIGLGHYITFTTTNICLVQIAKEKISSWVLYSHGFFGIGALTSPIFIRAWELQAYYLMAIMSLFLSLLCFYFPAPDRSEAVSKNIINNQKQLKFASSNL
jgi:hypothetical protein